MREEIKTQKGFIQIPLLVAIIIAVVITSGVGAGVVLHKQGKLAPLLANISQVFKGSEEAPFIESEKEAKNEQDQQIPERKPTEEIVSPQPISPGKPKTSGDKETQNRIQELEQNLKEPEKKQQAPFQPSIPPQCPSGSILCNNKCWNPCPTGYKLDCPSIGDAKCLEVSELLPPPSLPSTSVDAEYLFNNSAVIISSGEEPIFLGKITSKYDIDSVLNRYGNYGSKYSINSIFNKYGMYGGKYSYESPFNKYSLDPPKIYIGSSFWGYLSRNKYLFENTLNPNDLLLFAYSKYNDDSYLELMIVD